MISCATSHLLQMQPYSRADGIPSCSLPAIFASQKSTAQSLGYEGPTGVFVTPLAYTSASQANGLGKPSVSYHFLAAGNVVGDFSTVSITEGFAKRFEFGYTSEIHAAREHAILPRCGTATSASFTARPTFCRRITASTLGFRPSQWA